MKADTAELTAWLTLSLAPGLSDSALRALLQKFGPPEAVLALPMSALCAVIERPVIESFSGSSVAAQVASSLRWLEQPGNHLVTLADPDYPALLLESGDPPSVLYVKGRRELLGARSLAVVGSRNPTPQGLTNAERFSQSLSDAGLTVVSGLALGIDTAAHQGGLAGAASSIAVVGTGLDIVYPARNRSLAHRLAEAGALVSEFPLGTPGRAGNFPRRNRIISGLSQGCLVVEAAIASGSLITARLAGEQGREVFAIPGSIHSPLSKGCHQLIKQGAKLVESSDDILVELGLTRAAPAAQGTRRRKPAPGVTDPTLSPNLPTTPEAPGSAGAELAALREALGHDPVTLEALVQRLGIPVELVQARLLELEMAGEIAVMPGGKFQRQF